MQTKLLAIFLPRLTTHSFVDALPPVSQIRIPLLEQTVSGYSALLGTTISFVVRIHGLICELTHINRGGSDCTSCDSLVSTSRALWGGREREEVRLRGVVDTRNECVDRQKVAFVVLGDRGAVFLLWNEGLSTANWCSGVWEGGLRMDEGWMEVVSRWSRGGEMLIGFRDSGSWCILSAMQCSHAVEARNSLQIVELFLVRPDLEDYVHEEHNLIPSFCLGALTDHLSRSLITVPRLRQEPLGYVNSIAQSHHHHLPFPGINKRSVGQSQCYVSVLLLAGSLPFCWSNGKGCACTSGKKAYNIPFGKIVSSTIRG